MTFSIHAYGSDRFFTSLYDVPVLADLKALPDSSYSYDTLSGKIAHEAALTEGQVEPVYQAYDRVLPQFGWEKVAEGAYNREGEILSISHEAIDNAWVFYFMIKPKGENSQK